MTRHVRVEWPDSGPFRGRAGQPIRLLAVSDQVDPALEDPRNRRALGPIDLIVGCGDLEPDDLGFIVDAVNAPLIFVRGNHDGGAAWQATEERLPVPLRSGVPVRQAGITAVGFGWAGRYGRDGARRHETRAWRDALGLLARRVLRPRTPLLVISHAPPLHAGDVGTDSYHRGFRAYRWLLERVRPPLWVHGHTPLASADEWTCHAADTTIVNATGSVLIELWPPAAPGGSGRGTIRDEVPEAGRPEA